MNELTDTMQTGAISLVMACMIGMAIVSFVRTLGLRHHAGRA